MLPRPFNITSMGNGSSIQGTLDLFTLREALPASSREQCHGTGLVMASNFIECPVLPYGDVGPRFYVSSLLTDLNTH